MSFWKRLFSSAMRRGLEAEAAQDFVEAARAYARAGDARKVSEMHLRMAGGALDGNKRLEHLRSAQHWCGQSKGKNVDLAMRIAEQLEHWADAIGVLASREREVLADAARLYDRAGQHGRAGDLWERLGEGLAAAEAYQRGGEIEKLERILSREEVSRRREQRTADAFEEYRMQRDAGQRRAALDALAICLEDSAHARHSEWQRLHDELKEHRIIDGRVALRGQRGTRVYIGASPFVIGRDAQCAVAIADAGLSRRHAQIERGSDGSYTVLDLGSRNGTRLGGVRIESALPLPARGELSFGDGCALAVEIEGATQTLRLSFAASGTFAKTFFASPAPLSLGEGLSLSFQQGIPILEVHGKRGVFLNEVHIADRAELIIGDRLRIDHEELEVAIA